MWAIRTTTISFLAVGLLAGSALGVAAQDEAFFTWQADRSATGEGLDGVGTVEEFSGYLTVRDMTYIGQGIVADDARASGLLTSVYNEDHIGDRIAVRSVALRLVNDGGSWSGAQTELVHFPAEGSEGSSGGLSVLTGADGYEGLTLYLITSEDGFAPGVGGLGWIVPSDRVPPVPELPTE